VCIIIVSINISIMISTRRNITQSPNASQHFCIAYWTCVSIKWHRDSDSENSISYNRITLTHNCTKRKIIVFNSSYRHSPSPKKILWLFAAAERILQYTCWAYTVSPNGSPTAITSQNLNLFFTNSSAAEKLIKLLMYTIGNTNTV